MSSEHALIDLVARVVPSERRPHATPTSASKHVGPCEMRARLLRVVVRKAFRRVKRLLRLWRRRLAESDALRTMSDRELRDFGITRYDAAHEAKKVFWRQ